MAPAGSEAFFYRTGAGAEVDLVLELRPGRRWVFEFKRSKAPVLARGFHEACKDLAPEKKLVIFPGTEGFPLGGDVEAMGVNAAMELLRLA